MKSKQLFPGNADDGYTLIELIVAMQLFIIVSTLLYSIFIFGHRFTSKWIKESIDAEERTMDVTILEKEFSNVREYIYFHDHDIYYLNKNYLKTHLLWNSDSITISNFFKRKILKKISIGRYKLLSLDNPGNLRFTGMMLFLSRDSLFIPFRPYILTPGNQ